MAFCPVLSLLNSFLEFKRFPSFEQVTALVLNSVNQHSRLCKMRIGQFQNQLTIPLLVIAVALYIKFSAHSAGWLRIWQLGSKSCVRNQACCFPCLLHKLNRLYSYSSSTNPNFTPNSCLISSCRPLWADKALYTWLSQNGTAVSLDETSLKDGFRFLGVLQHKTCFNCSTVSFTPMS